MFVLSSMFKTLVFNDMHPSSTVQELKDAILLKTNVSPKNYSLQYEGKILDDGCSLASYGIGEGSTIMMFMRMPTNNWVVG